MIIVNWIPQFYQQKYKLTISTALRMESIPFLFLQVQWHTLFLTLETVL